MRPKAPDRARAPTGQGLQRHGPPAGQRTPAAAAAERGGGGAHAPGRPSSLGRNPGALGHEHRRLAAARGGDPQDRSGLPPPPGADRDGGGLERPSPLHPGRAAPAGTRRALPQPFHRQRPRPYRHGTCALRRQADRPDHRRRGARRRSGAVSHRPAGPAPPDDDSYAGSEEAPMAGGAALRREVAIGIIGLDTTFTKIPGHIRNRSTFDFPVVYRVVEGATAERVVKQADPTLLQPFVRAAQELEAEGVGAITSACGFLVIFQKQLADAVSVPLYASSLIQVPMVHRMLGSNRKLGLLVARKDSLTPRHLEAIGAESIPLCIAGMEEQPEFREVMLEARRAELDVDRLEHEVLGQAERLASENRDLGALVIECTDLVPFSHAIQARLGLPVFDIVTLTEMVHRSLTRRPYGVVAAL